jgi:hypothetical protein
MPSAEELTEGIEKLKFLQIFSNNSLNGEFLIEIFTKFFNLYYSLPLSKNKNLP